MASRSDPKALNLVSTKSAASSSGVGAKVQIALPSLCSYDDDDSDDEDADEQALLEANSKLKNLASATAAAPSGPATVAKKPDKPASGLLSLLPPPKGNAFLKKPAPVTNGLLPRSLQPASKTTPQTKTAPKTTTALKTTPATTRRPVDDDDDDGESLSSSNTPSNSAAASRNFLMTQHVSQAAVYKAPPPPSTLAQIVIAPVMQHDNQSDPDPFNNQYNDDEDERADESSLHRHSSACGSACGSQTATATSTVEDQPQPSSSSSSSSSSGLINNEAWIKLCGNKRKQREAEGIEFVDVNASAIIGNNSAELMKQITSDYRPPSNKDYFAGSSRKKHQITYLAYVAKARDQELKNEWSQNKFNKQQARQKYGF